MVPRDRYIMSHVDSLIFVVFELFTCTIRFAQVGAFCVVSIAIDVFIVLIALLAFLAHVQGRW